jgi:hypothetical protein
MSTLACIVYGEGGHAYVGLHNVWRRWVCLCWPTLFRMVGMSILAYMVHEGDRVYICWPTWSME